MPKPWMIYGANGYTGDLIAQKAAGRGLKPVLAGRTAAKLEPLAASLGLQARVFDLRDAAATARNVEGMVLVLNCAGPFSATAAPMMAACLATHAHYLDITALERGEDGLTLSWLIPDDSRSWLYGNFPWGAGRGEPRPLPEWAGKFRSEVELGNVPRGVTLWPYSPDTDWYKNLMAIPGIQEIRITRKGLRFGNAKNGPSTNLKVLALLVVGLTTEEIAALRNALTRHGVDVVPDTRTE